MLRRDLLRGFAAIVGGGIVVAGEQVDHMKILQVSVECDCGWKTTFPMELNSRGCYDAIELLCPECLALLIQRFNYADNKTHGVIKDIEQKRIAAAKNEAKIQEKRRRRELAGLDRIKHRCEEFCTEG